MKIYLIRHAQAVHNVTGNTGLLDPEITELDKQQCLNKKETTWSDGEIRAKKVIELLNKIKNDNIVIALVSHANFIRNIMALLSVSNSLEIDNCDSYVLYL